MKRKILNGIILALLVLMFGSISIQAEGEAKFVEMDGVTVYTIDGVPCISLNGLVQYGDGWFYLEKGVLQSDKCGFVDYGTGTFYLANGQVTDYSGLVQDGEDWYFLAAGQLQKEHTGFALYDNEWFYIRDGKLAQDVNGLQVYDGRKFLVAAGRILYSYSGLFENTDGKWYYIASGMAQEQYSGLAEYDNAWFYLQNGIIDTSFSGLYEYSGKRFLVGSGQVLSNYTGTYSEGYNCYSVEAGQIKYAIPQPHTQEEIKAFFAAHPYSGSNAVTYSVVPSMTDYISGKLSDATLQDGLNAVNTVRYIAGMPYDITCSSTYNQYAQDGAFVLASNGTGLTHTPSNTSGIPAALFESGYKGTSSSNIGRGYGNISSSVIRGYMNDGSGSNLQTIGHRRWILCPNMQYIGFGYCNGYTTTYVFDSARKGYEVDYITWPATNQPAELFYGPWSVQLSQSTFNINDQSNISVVMTDMNDGRTWTFSNSREYSTSERPYFNVDTSNYGWMDAIIFHPGEYFDAGDRVKVDITGLVDSEGNAASISYEVNFFSMN